MAKKPDWESLRSARSEGRGAGREAGVFTKVLTIAFVGLGGAALGGLAVPFLVLDQAGRRPGGNRMGDFTGQDLAVLAIVGAAIGLVLGVSAVIKWWPRD
jgi:hypothetical protein